MSVLTPGNQSSEGPHSPGSHRARLPGPYPGSDPVLVPASPRVSLVTAQYIQLQDPVDLSTQWSSHQDESAHITQTSRVRKVRPSSSQLTWPTGARKPCRAQTN